MRGLRRTTLGIAVDAEEVRVLPGEPDDEPLTVHVDPEVPVGDAAAERLGAHVSSRPTRHRFHDGSQVGVQRHRPRR
jgi:hypothetical protein